VRDLAEKKLATIEQRLNEMTALRKELRAVLRDWDTKLAKTPPGRQSRLLEFLDLPAGLHPKRGTDFTTTGKNKSKLTTRKV
jgi:hypothetical protein